MVSLSYYNLTLDKWYTYAGSLCNMVGTTKLPFGHSPLMLYNGEVSCQTLTGKISILRLNSHVFTDDQGITEDEVCTSFIILATMFH